MALPIMVGTDVDVSFVDKRKSPKGAMLDTTNFGTPANWMSVATVDAALTAANGAYYTSAKLQTLTVNDKVWALRQLTESASI